MKQVKCMHGEKRGYCPEGCGKPLQTSANRLPHLTGASPMNKKATLVHRYASLVAALLGVIFHDTQTLLLAAVFALLAISFSLEDYK